jgi:hypothetical protein
LFFRLNPPSDPAIGGRGRTCPYFVGLAGMQ